MLLLPIAPDHISKAKASTCSSQVYGTSFSISTSGGCSMSNAAGQHAAILVFQAASGSSCQSVSASHPAHIGHEQGSNGAVSCSSHSP
jgi:hypothetical protein